MADPEATPTPKGNRPPRNNNRNKRNDGTQPQTPGKPNTARQQTPGSKQEGGYHSSSGRLQKNQNQKAHHNNDRSGRAIPSLDGAASPRMTTRPISIQPRDENVNRFTTPAKQAYAGPTFHASPAPSSLPMPKFFSKSMPSQNPIATASAAEQDSTNAIDRSIPPSPAPTPRGLQPPAAMQREASPLDLLFNAQRAEQARQKAGASGSPQLQTQRPTSYMSQMQNNPANGYQTPVSVSRQHSYHGQTQPSNKEMFMMEVDGTNAEHDRTPYSTTSFDERLRAAQSQSSPRQPDRPVQMDEEQRLAKSLALKQLLKGQSGGPSYGSPDFAPAQMHLDPSAYARPQYPPQQNPTQSPGQTDLRAMEANLKKMLKLAP